MSGDMKPMSSISARAPVWIAWIASPRRKTPSTTRTNATTPRYWSNTESKISARGSPRGAPARGGDLVADRLEDLLDALACLGRDPEDLVLTTQQLRDLVRDALGL